MEKDISKIHVVHFVNEVPVAGAMLDGWPSHVTFVPPFELADGLGLGDVLDTVEDAAGKYGPLTLHPIGHDMKGPKNEKVETVVIKRTDEMHKLHLDLVHALEGLGIVFTDTRWMLDRYSPHLTIKNGIELTEPTICDSLSINMKRLGQKVVAGTVRLGGR